VLACSSLQAFFTLNKFLVRVLKYQNITENKTYNSFVFQLIISLTTGPLVSLSSKDATKHLKV
jgi:hypothetical protein